MDKTKEFHYQGEGGLNLVGLAWLPEETPKAVMAVEYGLGEYAGRYERILEFILPAGYAVYVTDLRGHGQSQGQRGHITRFSQYHADLRAFLDFIKADQPGLPIFLFGNSLGALIVSEYIERETDDIRGAMLMGGPYQPAEIADPAKVITAKVLSRFWPTFPIDLGIQPEQYTRDPGIIAYDRGDAKFKTVVSARWGTECLSAVDYVNAHPGDIRTPVLVLHGSADRLNAVEGATRFYNGITFADKTLKVYPGGYHCLHYDLDRRQVLADMVAWMDQRLL